MKLLLAATCVMSAVAAGAAAQSIQQRLDDDMQRAFARQDALLAFFATEGMLDRIGDRWLDVSACTELQDSSYEEIGTYYLLAAWTDRVAYEPFDLACAMTDAGHEITAAAVIRYNDVDAPTIEHQRIFVRFRLAGGGEIVLENQGAHFGRLPSTEAGKEDGYSIGEYGRVWRWDDGAYLSLPYRADTDRSLAGNVILQTILEPDAAADDIAWE